MSFQIKLTTLIYSKAKAILFVSDPKSGFRSFEESSPGIAGYLQSKMSLKGEKEDAVNPVYGSIAKGYFC